MAAFVPNWVATDSVMSGQSLATAYAPGSNPALAAGVEPAGMYVQGFDPSLGIGQFIYAQVSNAAGVTAGNVCEMTQTLLTGNLTWGSYTVSFGSGVALMTSVQQWQGTANSGKNLCVALATLTQYQFGWFQVYGNALLTSSGAIVGGTSSAYWQANGVVQAGAVASKQMVSAIATVANSASFGQAVSGVVPALSATQSIYFINAPHAQSAIT